MSSDANPVKPPATHAAHGGTLHTLPTSGKHAEDVVSAWRNQGHDVHSQSVGVTA